MSSRLDRLVGLLDNGGNRAVRQAAAQQIGVIQRQHPGELYALLSRVYEHIRNTNWDTRVAAAMAVAEIAKNVPEWDPNSTDGSSSSPIPTTKQEAGATATDLDSSPSKTVAKDVATGSDGASEENSEEQDDNDEEELLDFAQLNVDSILCHGRLLLGSAGKEYEIEEDDSVDAGERLAKHRRQLKQQLGLGGQFLDDEMLVNEADLITIPTRGSGMAAGRRLKRKEADAEDIKLLAIGDDGVAQAESDPPGIDMSKLSARERNRLKRKAKRSVKSVKAKIDLNQPSKQPAAEKTTPMEVEVTEQPGDSGKIMVEAKHPEDKAALFAISSGRWPFDRFVKVLCMDLFDPQWQVRQGAGMALREIFKAQGRGAGRSAGLDREGNRRGAQQYLVDICIRLLCVFALDRFGDFVSDQVVAPVRETCAQALGAVVRYLDTPGVEGVRSVLMQLIQRGSQPGLEVWEMRHAGFLGLKYLAAVTRNVDGPVIDAVLGGLGDADDDIRGVSAETLLPLVDGLIEDLEARIMDVVEALWKALSDIGDDLAASTSSIMDLLAALFQHDKVRQKVLVTSRNRPEFGFSVLLPKLFPFFRHTLTGVRRAAVETTRTLVEIQHESAACSGNGSSDDQVNTACIRMTFQNMLVETNDHVLGQSLELWRLLISTICEVEGEQCLPRILPRELVASMFCLTFTPIGVPLDTKLMFRPSLSLSPPLPSLGSSPVTTSCVRHNVDEPMLRQELSLVPPSLIMRCRIALSQALGELMSLWQRASLAEVFGGILAGYIESSVSLHRQLSGTVIEEWVVAEKRRLCGRPLVGDRSGGPVAPLPLDIESISVDVVAKGPLAATLADRLLRVVASTVGGGQRVYYSDLVSLLRQVHADAQRLVQAFTDELKMPPASTVTIPPHCMGDAAQSAQASGDVFTPELADHIKDAVYPSVVGSLPSRSSKTILNSLEEKFRRLSSSLAHYQLQDQRLSMEVNASLAGAIVALGRLPQKLAPVIKSLTSAIKDQNDPLLQRRSARSVAQLTLHCLTGPNRRAGPADKLVKNLSVFLCSNQWDTPDFAKLSAQGSNEGILMLELNQHRQERDEMKAFIAKTASTGSVSGGEATGTKAFSTAVNADGSSSARGRGRGGRGRGGRGATAKREPASGSAEAATDSASGTASNNRPADPEGVAEIVVRGAELTFDEMSRLFGPRLFELAPKVWQLVVEPLSGIYGQLEALGDADVKLVPTEMGAIARRLLEPKLQTPEAVQLVDERIAQSGNPGEIGQSVVDGLRVLSTVARSVDPALRDRLLETLPWVLSTVESKYAAIRNAGSRALSALCCVNTMPVMQAIIQSLLPILGDTTRVYRRRGVSEAVHYVVDDLGERVLPYLTFLMVPVLARMSDHDEQTRLVCTHCFAQLLRLVPLEAGVPDPAGLPPELIAQRERERKFLDQLMDSSKLEPFRIPIKIHANLRRYQQEGVNWLAFLNRYELHGILCDDMGLGKTLQSICILASDHHFQAQKFRESGGRDMDCAPLPSLVVCPPTLLHHWEGEITQYTDNLRTLVYAGLPQDRRRHILRIASYDVVVTSYDLVRNDIDYLAKVHWNYCILDEGHVIKNARTKLTQAVKRVEARHRLILSGTPVQNHVLELWSLFDFLMPGFLGTEKQFVDQYSKPILASRDAKKSSAAQAEGQAALDALHKQVLPFILRRMKEDVLQDLPPKIIQDYYCELSDIQRTLYDDFVRSAVSAGVRQSLEASESEASAGGEKTAKAKGLSMHIFQALQYMRKLCNHPRMVLTPKHPRYTEIMTSLAQRGVDLSDISLAPKLLALRELLCECGIGTLGAVTAAAGGGGSNSSSSSRYSAGGSDVAVAVEEAAALASANHRALVFCQHKEMLDRIQSDLLDREMPGVSYLRFDGSVPAQKRQSIVNQFNSDPSIDLLLLTTHVGGLGLNLTSADTVIFVEHDWNPMMDRQAMDRAHRLGQTRVVNVYRLITRGTLEEKIMGLQNFKMNMANAIINQQNSGIGSMNTDELLDLFTPASTSAVAESKRRSVHGENNKGQTTAKAAIEGLGELWDATQYEEEYNLDNFLESLHS